MDPKELKKTLARISLASLIATSGIALVGCATSCEGKKEVKTEQGETAGSGKTEKTAGSEETGKTACSGKASGTSCSGETSCG